MNDLKIFKWLIALIIVVPALYVAFSEDKFRYPCQNPANWDKDVCKMPICDVTRTCPEHIFKGQRDPRLGPPKEDNTAAIANPTAPQGVTCAK